MIQVMYCGDPTLLNTMNASTSARASGGNRRTKLAPRHALNAPSPATAATAAMSRGVMTATTTCDPGSHHLEREDVAVVVDGRTGDAEHGAPEVPRADRRLELETTVGLVGDEAESVVDAAAREDRREREHRDERGAGDHREAAPDRDHRRDEERCRPHLDPGRDGQEDRSQPRSADEPQTARQRERHRDRVEPVHPDRAEERDEREPEPRGRRCGPSTGRGPPGSRRPAASHSVIRIAHATSYPAIQAKPCASTIGTRASCGYTHDSVTPTTARPSIAHVDHGS